MVALAILRVEKLKSFGNIGGSEKHTARLQDTPNADPTKKNIRLIGECDERSLEDVVKGLIQSRTKYQPRKDAVLCSEIFLSASPEYFRPSDPSLAGEWDDQRMLDFTKASQNWLESNYGDKCVRAELHLDEATPHIHAYIVPVNEKTKRLSYKEMFGGSPGQGRVKLSLLQDSYAKVLAPLGIERGVKGSNATHTKVKEYYQAVNSRPLSLELERFTPLPGESAQELLDRIKNDKRIQDLDHQLADRRRIIKLEKRASQKAIASEKLRQNLGRRLLEQERENLTWRQQAEQLRDLPLSDVAWQLGLDRDRRQQNRWRGQNHIINIDGSKFYDFHPTVQKGGGGSIDLVMHVNSCNFRQAIAWLNDRYGESGAERAAIAQAKKVTAEIIQSEPPPQFTAPIENKIHWQTVSNYLTQKRGIPSNFVQALHERGFMYADEQQNAVFLMRDLNGETTGAFLRGTRGENNTFKGYEKGTKRTDGWFYFHLGGQPKGKVERTVLCKSPIEALSRASFELETGMPQQRTMYLVVDSPKNLPVDFLQTVPTVEMVFDDDDLDNEAALHTRKLLNHATKAKPRVSIKEKNEGFLEKLDWQQQKRSSQHEL